MNDSDNALIQCSNFDFKGTIIGFGQDQAIRVNQVAHIPHQKLMEDLFPLEHLTDYYKNPDSLILNANRLVKELWNEQSVWSI